MAATARSVEHMQVPDGEKLKTSHIDESGSDKSAFSEHEQYSEGEQRKIIHRVDRRLVVTCGVMYCVSLMDRTNLGQAAIAGMTKELELTVGFRYVGPDARRESSKLTSSLVHHRARLFHHLCPFSAPCYRLVPKDWPSTGSGGYHTCLGSSNGMFSITNPVSSTLTRLRLEWASPILGLF